MIADVSSKSLAELLSLKGRTAVITGGAAGIGLATARRFAEAGANVVVADLNEEAGQLAATELKAAYGGNPSFVRLDVSRVESIVEAADFAEQRYGGLHVWANIAGIYPVQDTLDLTPEQWDKVMTLNLKGTFFASREAARRMMKQATGGVILNTHSTTAYKTVPGIAHYIASKGGVEALTKALAGEFGPHNIRVLAVSPTLTETEGTAQQKPDLDRAFGDIDSHAAYAAKLPLRRLGRPDDIARVFLMLASDLSSFLTGSTIPVDGGDLTF